MMFLFPGWDILVSWKIISPPSPKLGIWNPPKNAGVKPQTVFEGKWKKTNIAKHNICPMSTWINFKFRYPKKNHSGQDFLSCRGNFKDECSHHQAPGVSTCYPSNPGALRSFSQVYAPFTCTGLQPHQQAHLLQIFSTKGQFIIAYLQFHLPTFKVHTSKRHCQGIVGCTPIPTYPYGKSLYKPYISPLTLVTFCWPPLQLELPFWWLEL